MQNGLLKGFNAGLFLLSALVLVVDRSIGAVGVLMVLLALVMLARQRTPKLLLERDEKYFIVALCSYPLVVALGIVAHGGWVWADFDHASRFLLALPLFFAARRFGASRELFYAGLMIGAVGAGCFGYYQKYIEGLWVAHGYIHKISFGNISLMLGVLSLTYCIKPTPNHELKWWVVVAAIIAFGFGLMGSITSGTRGGWIAVPFMLWLILREAIAHKPLRYAIYALFLGSAVALYSSNELVSYKVGRAVTDTLGYFGDEKKVLGSAGTRLEMWRAAGTMFAESPLIGVGKGEYRSAVQGLMAEGRIHLPVDYGHAHNDYLHALAELGVLGGISLLLLYGLMARFYFRARAVDLRLATAGLLLCFGYVDFGMTQVMLKHNITTIFLVANAALLAGMLSYRRRQQAMDSTDLVAAEAISVAPAVVDRAARSG